MSAIRRLAGLTILFTFPFFNYTCMAPSDMKKVSSNGMKYYNDCSSKYVEFENGTVYNSSLSLYRLFENRKNEILMSYRKKLENPETLERILEILDNNNDFRISYPEALKAYFSEKIWLEIQNVLDE